MSFLVPEFLKGATPKAIYTISEINLCNIPHVVTLIIVNILEYVSHKLPNYPEY